MVGRSPLLLVPDSSSCSRGIETVVCVCVCVCVVSMPAHSKNHHAHMRTCGMCYTCMSLHSCMGDSLLPCFALFVAAQVRDFQSVIGRETRKQ